MVSDMHQHQSHQHHLTPHRDLHHAQQFGQDADHRFYPAALVARIAQRDLSTIHRWCRIGYLAGAIRGNGPGRQPWLIPEAEAERVALTLVIPAERSEQTQFKESHSTTSRQNGAEGASHGHPSPLDP